MRTGGKSYRGSNEGPAMLTPQILMLPKKGGLILRSHLSSCILTKRSIATT